MALPQNQNTVKGTPRKFFGEPKNFSTKELPTKDFFDPVPPAKDGTQEVYTDASFGGYDAKVNRQQLQMIAPHQSEAELIRLYRDIADHQEVDFAIDEITNEIFVTDGEATPVSLDLDEIETLEDDVKEKIKEEFGTVLRLLNFNRDAFDIFRRFYIDARLAYYKVVNPSKPTEGIQELRYVEPQSIRKIREYVVDKERSVASDGFMTKVLSQKEYYLYSPNSNLYSSGNDYGSVLGSEVAGIMGSTQNTTVISSYAVAYVHSGLYDHRNNCIKGHLHKAIKPLNDLLNLETHMIIYRVARAPEKKVFYIDTGSMPPSKAQQYLNFVQDSYRREVEYDASTGKIKSNAHTISMQEDYWLPRSSTGKGTEVDVLQGASNLNQIEDIEYMNHKFHNSLNIPPSRFDRQSGATLLFGSNDEMNREEIKFQKFIGRLRSRFNSLFRDILGTQVVLKQILSLEEWEEIAEHIAFDYVKDSHLEDSRKFSVMKQQAAVIAELSEMVGTFISKNYIWKEVMGLTDEEISEMKLEIQKERDEEPSIDSGF